MQVRDLAAAICVVRRVGVTLRLLQGPHARSVLAKLVAGHREVERGLEVAGVDLERLLETPARFGKPAAEVVDDAEAVEHVGVAESLLHELLVVGLRKRILGAIVVLVRRVQNLLSPRSHGPEGSDGPIAGQKSARALSRSCRARRWAFLASSLSGNRWTISSRGLPSRLHLFGLQVDLAEQQQRLRLDPAARIGGQQTLEPRNHAAVRISLEVEARDVELMRGEQAHALLHELVGIGTRWSSG